MCAGVSAGGRAGTGSAPGGSVLVARERDCGRLDALLDAARAGRSGVLVVRGESGIGKTVLLDYAADRAAGMRVMRARGVEVESGLAFAGLHELLRPVLGSLGSLPERQAAALRGALALSESSEVDRFAAYVATLGVLAAAAEERPLLVLIDDAQWLDGSSAEALLFAGRRLEAEGIALVFAARESDPDEFVTPDFEELHVRGLDRGAVQRLLAQRGIGTIAPQVLDRLAGETAGNPLALIELGELLSAEQLAGEQPLEEPLAAGEAAQRGFVRRALGLSSSARSALVVAAAAGDGELDPLLAALEGLGVGRRPLEEIEAAGLIRVADGRLAFGHPLVRSTVYAAAEPAQLRAAHRALADALGEERADRRAWHLASAAAGPDEEVAAALERAAAGARRRSGYAAAARAFERAAQLTPPGGAQAERLAAAADAARQAGHGEHALALFNDALLDTTDPARRADIEHLRGRIELWRGRAHRGQQLHRRAAELVAASDSELAAVLLVHASVAAWYAGDAVSALDNARGAHELAGGRGGPAGLLADLALGSAWHWLGDSASAHQLMADSVRKIDARRLGELTPERRLYVSQWLLASGVAVDRAGAMIDDVLEQARASGAIGLLPYGLYAAFYLRLRDGNWASAYAGAAEGTRLAADTGDVLWHAFNLGLVAFFEAAQGRESECRDHAEQALSLSSQHDFAPQPEIAEALGLLELGAGRPHDAVQHLERATRAFGVAERSGGAPRRLARPALGDLVEAHVRAGEPPSEQLLAAVREAGESDFFGSRAISARCDGMIAAEDRFAAHFERALKLHAAAFPFDRARTELCYGERLRRARRRVDARVHLRAALEVFQRLGARPWAERASDELRATGERIARRDPTASEKLTSQELEIALTVVRGATNREAGAALFLSPKTIEAHLGRVYRKLGIRSRTELAHVLQTAMT